MARLLLLIVASLASGSIVDLLLETGRTAVPSGRRLRRIRAKPDGEAEEENAMRVSEGRALVPGATARGAA